ncbi:CoB--CoM heterodisulfide reductase iron-sulfur subunit B family protein [Candidatus Bathyarchaeota archaeon]|nr:CoB--CoM heterodisulfide reductase iron-sulfur subunit B family protein [Candidatus Bathyarchaeota archaeon]
MNKKYGVFLGCTISAVQIFVEKALKLLGEKFSIELIDLEDATCCPEPEISKTISYEAWLRIAARNLSLCEKVSNELCVICNGCYHTFKKANEALSNENLLKEVNAKLNVIGKTYKGTVKVKNFIEILYEDVGLENLKLKRDLSQIKACVHPGCRLLEESRLVSGFKDLIKATEASIIEWDAEKMCCGVPAMYTNPEFALENRAKRKVLNLKDVKPDCLIVICPACYDMLEKAEISYLEPEEFIPIINIVEFLAYAAGYSSEEIGFDLHRIPLDNFLIKVEEDES